MKKEISPMAVIGGIIGLVAVVGLVIFLAVKSDPASQAPNPPPRFDPAVKAAESRSNPMMNRSAPGSSPNPAAPR